jgi:uncharacterized protein involved in oxidation of intracellular sulfur
MAASEKLVFMVTHGADHPEHITIPFVMAAAALASDVAVVMGFQADAVAVMKAGVAETVHAPGFAPLEKLMRDVRDLGGAFLVCSPCLNSRDITPDQLVDGAEIVAAGRFVAEVTSATNVLTY